MPAALSMTACGRMFESLATAKLDYVASVFSICAQLGCRAFAIVVFDELEKSQSHLLIDQMRRYFADTVVGQQRSNRIIPEPFFVHSDLTNGVQIADLVAYVISWGFRTPQMTKPARAELSQLSVPGCRSALPGHSRAARQP